MLDFGISIIRCLYIDLPCASKQNYYEVKPFDLYYMWLLSGILGVVPLSLNYSFQSKNSLAIILFTAQSKLCMKRKQNCNCN